MCRVNAISQVVGIPYWNDDSLKSVIDHTSFSEEVKDILTAIHKMTVRFCQDHGLNHEAVSITSGHFVELLSRIDESVEIKINCNKKVVEDLKSIVKVVQSCEKSITAYLARLEGNNKLLDTFREELKAIKKNIKSLNEGLENLSKEVEAEQKVNEGLKANVEKLEEKYRDIKEASFDEHGRVIGLIKAITPEERVAFAKPLIVHDDVEKICTILMILLKMDVFGWKPFKDKFLSDDWPRRLVELDPDQCKHKQVFIINKKLNDIKTSKADMATLSPIGTILWDYIEGVLKAFTTEFERSKLSREIERMQGKLDTSADRLAGLRAEEEAKKRNIEQQNQEYEKKTKDCDSKEKETAELTQLLQKEQKFVKTSAFFASHCSTQSQELQVDESEALQEAIIQETASTYFGPFDTQQRGELLKSTKHIVRNLSGKDLAEVDFLQAFDLLAIDSDLTDNMENLTKKRMLFCQDPNDLVTLSLEREGELGKRSIKLYDKDDIQKIIEYLKDESCSCILIEDAYFQNIEIMNFLLDDSLEELCLMAQQYDKFIFIITKVDSYCLPHKAYSKLYFINLKLSYTEVMRLMTSQFNCHTKKQEYGRLQELLEKDGVLEEEIAELQEKVIFDTLVRHKKKDQEQSLLNNLAVLEVKMEEMASTKAEINTILNSINFEKSELTKSATPIIVSLYLLSKMSLCATPSFHHLCEATKRHYDQLEEKDNLMFKIFVMFSFQIQESIRTLMAAFMAMASLAMTGAISEQDIGRFTEICRKVGEEEREGGISPLRQEDAIPPPWVTPQQAALLAQHGLLPALQEKEEEWGAWYRGEASLPSLPSPFTALLLAVLLRPKATNSQLVDFVKATIGFAYLESDTIIVADVHSFSSPNDPIVFLLGSSVEEPSSDLTKLADLQGIASSKVKYLALAQENVPLAMELLETAFIRGQWLIFQNVDLVPNFLPKLDKRIQEKDPEDVHEDFRVWMTWTSGHLPTFSLLQRAIVLSCEPCRDIRYHNSNFLYNIPLKTVKQQEFLQSILFFTLAYLQKAFACRQKFSGLSWSAPPQLPNYLMQTAYQFLAQYFSVAENSVKAIQYRQLLEWSKRCLYYNHMTDLVDRETISMYLDEYIGQFLFEQHNPFRSRLLTREALEREITARTEELRNLPGTTAAMVMLAPAADRLHQIVMSQATLRHVRSFGEDGGQHLSEATEQLQRLIKVVEEPEGWEVPGPGPGQELARVQVARLEGEHVRKMARGIREEIDSVELCLMEGYWPSPDTLTNIEHILGGTTPPGWRWGQY